MRYNFVQVNVLYVLYSQLKYIGYGWCCCRCYYVMYDKFFQVCKMVHTVQRAPLNSDLELKLARNSHKLKKHTHIGTLSSNFTTFIYIHIRLYIKFVVENISRWKARRAKFKPPPPPPPIRAFCAYIPFEGQNKYNKKYETISTFSSLCVCVCVCIEEGLMWCSTDKEHYYNQRARGRKLSHKWNLARMTVSSLTSTLSSVSAATASQHKVYKLHIYIKHSYEHTSKYM